MSSLEGTKKAIAANLKFMISAGQLIAGDLLPFNPVRIDVVGKSESNLQARVIYADQAPYYLNVHVE